MSSKADRDSISNEIESDRGSIDLADPLNFSSKMGLDPPTQDANQIDDNASDVSEGSSIDFDAPPGKIKTVPGTRSRQNDHVTAARLYADLPVPRTLPDHANHHTPVRLASDSLIPPPLKDLINQWCASKGPSYPLTHLPCLTTTDPRRVNQSTTGKTATWEYRDGKPMKASMYALTGIDLRPGQRKILVVEGTSEVLGPFIVSYTTEGSTSNRVSFKKWVGLGGDKNGFEKGYSVIKVYPLQTQLPPGKRRVNRPSIADDEVVSIDLKNNTLGSRKRKRQSGTQDDSSFFTTHSDSGPEMTGTGRRTPAASTSRTTNREFNQTLRRPNPSQVVPVVNIPSRTASSKGHVWHTLETPPQESFAEPNTERHDPGLRATSLRTSQSQIVTKLDLSTNEALAESLKEPIASAAKRESPMAYYSASRNLTQTAEPLDYPSILPSVYEAAQRGMTSDMLAMLPPGYKPVQNPAPSHSPPLTPMEAPSVPPMNFDHTIMWNATAQALGHTKDRNEPSARKSSVQELKPAKSITNKELDVSRRATLPVASSSMRATTAESPYRTEAKSKDIDSGVERRISQDTDNIIATSTRVQKPGQITEPAASPPLPHTRSSTEDTSNAAGPARLPKKSRKKLKLQQVIIKFNSALRNDEAPRVRPFTACDTVQKLFNQARTGDVFGKASEVRSGGKVLTVEFRGSGRLYDEVYLINEGDEEDFARMKNALLKKDWWTEVDEEIVGGGLLDVRDAR
jgi:hypothetical protein